MAEKRGYMPRLVKDLSPFYMKKIPNSEINGHVFTESCDLLMPNVGEIVGEFSFSFS